MDAFLSEYTLDNWLSVGVCIAATVLLLWNYVAKAKRREEYERKIRSSQAARIFWMGQADIDDDIRFPGEGWYVAVDQWILGPIKVGETLSIERFCSLLDERRER